MPLPVSLTSQRATYSALKLDGSWTEPKMGWSYNCRYFSPSHIAINATNGIETKGHPLRRGKATDLSSETKRLYHNREQHHGIRGHQGSRAAQACRVMVFAHVFLHLCRLFPAVAARAFARNARGKAAFRWLSAGSVAGDVLRDGSSLPDA